VPVPAVRVNSRSVLVAAREAFVEAWERSATERVEVACMGGLGRTGTTLACIAVLDGLPAGEAVGYVRRRYNHRAVETSTQRRFVDRFS
jgi:protein-tyrosine phosphatase